MSSVRVFNERPVPPAAAGHATSTAGGDLRITPDSKGFRCPCRCQRPSSPQPARPGPIRSSTSTSRRSRGWAAGDDRRDAGRRPVLHRGDKEPTPGRALIESLVWVACGLDLRGRRRRRVGARRVGRVPRRLPDREVPVGRQRVRVGGDLLDLRDPAPLPAPGVVLGRVRRARAARDLHHRRRRVDLEFLVVAPRVRRVPRLHGRKVLRHRRRRRHARARPRGEPLEAVHARVDRARRPSLLHAENASGRRRRCSPRSSSSSSPT